ncbi:MAG: efflux RND transporter periplasmic adaptor subunit [Litorimonas sp.]
MDDFDARNPDSNAYIGGVPPRKKPRKLLILRLLTFALPIVVLGTAVGGTIAMSAFSPEPEETDTPIKALPVLTATAKTDSVMMTVKAQGEVQPRTEINIVSQVGGRITYMSPDYIQGGRFNRGDLLVRIDPAEYKLRVTQARANVSQAQTVLARERSEADLARMDWEDLGRGGTPTPLTLREPQMAEAAAQLESAKARLEEAALQLSRTEIRAPFDGRVTERLVDAGEFVGMSSRLGKIYATDIMDVRLPMTQTDLARAGLFLGYEAKGDKGVPVRLTLTSIGSESEWTGYITRTDGRFDSQSRVLHVYAEVRNPFANVSEGRPPLAPGLYVDAEINGPVIDNVVTIPRAALRGTSDVYVANDDGTLSIKTVSVQSSDRTQAVLHSGIKAGDEVITSPIRGVAEGMKIEVVDPNAPKTAATTEGA